MKRVALKHSIILCITILSLAGCNGEIRSRVLTPTDLRAELSKPEGLRGVFGYYDRTAIEVDDLTQLVDAAGKREHCVLRPE